MGWLALALPRPNKVGNRRPHPLQHGKRILDGLQAERAMLADLRVRADLVIDTTSVSAEQAADAIIDHLRAGGFIA